MTAAGEFPSLAAVGRNYQVDGAWIRSWIWKGKQGFHYIQWIREISELVDEEKNWIRKYIIIYCFSQILKNEKRYIENIELNANRFELRTLAINSPNSDFGGSLFKDQLVFSSSWESKIIYKKFKWFPDI